MNPLLRLLYDNPVIAFFLLAWLAGAIGTALQKAKRTAEEQLRRRQGSRPEQPGRPEPRAQDQVADEIHEILGIEPPARRRPPPVEAAPREPVHRVEVRERSDEVAVREVSAGDRRAGAAPPPLPRPAEGRADRRSGDELAAAGQAIAAAARAARLGRIESHVGERLQARQARQARERLQERQVGQFGGQLGKLGARLPPALPPRTGGARSIDVGNLARLVIAREILDPPLSLR